MSLWDWLALSGAAFAVLWPLGSGMHTAHRHCLSFGSGLRIGLRRLRIEALRTTVIFLPVTISVLLFVACVALPAYFAHIVVAQPGLTVLTGVAGVLLGFWVAVKSVRSIGDLIFSQMPHMDKAPCGVCLRFREVDDINPCPECGEPAPEPEPIEKGTGP